MNTYKILGTDGKEYGPVSGEVLRQWIAQKRAIATTSVQTEGSGEWKPLSDFAEFADALPSGPAVLPPLPAAGPLRTSRLAIASLVCGIFGFLCLPGLASVVLGIIALVKISKNRGHLRGEGLAIAGLCLSGAMLLAVVPAGLVLPALARAKSKAMRINCVNNLKQIALAARMYSGDHKDVFPLDFRSLSNELVLPKILICPADHAHSAAANWVQFDPRQNATYEFLKPGIPESKALSQVIFRCPIHHNVALGDGSAQQRPPAPAGRPTRAAQ